MEKRVQERKVTILDQLTECLYQVLLSDKGNGDNYWSIISAGEFSQVHKNMSLISFLLFRKKTTTQQNNFLASDVHQRVIQAKKCRQEKTDDHYRAASSSFSK